MVSLQTPVCEFNNPAIEFCLPGVDGRQWSLQDCQGPNGLLVMFICNHCPYVFAVRERIVRDTKELLGYGIGSVAIMSNDTADYSEDSFENMQRISREFQFSFPYLLDESQQVARNYGAVCTPDFYGYNANLKLQYRGRLDSSGKQPASADAHRDLFEAMKQVAQTGNGPQNQIASMGCSIKWRNEV